jgi:hypothetical protein
MPLHLAFLFEGIFVATFGAFFGFAAGFFLFTAIGADEYCH